MRIKSYFVKSVDEAMAQARTELGGEALLLSTRKLDPQPGSQAAYEVVFGCVETTEPAGVTSESAATLVHPSPLHPNPLRSSPLQASPLQASPLQASPLQAPAPMVRQTALESRNAGEWTHDLDRLQAQMDEIHDLLLSSRVAMANSRRLPELAGIFGRLTDAGFGAALTNEIIDGMEAAMAAEATAQKPKSIISIGSKTGRINRGKVYDLLRTQLNARVRIDASLGVEGSAGTVVAMVGPGGAGKTTTLMKIAAFQAAPARPVRVLTLDSAGFSMPMQLLARKAGIALSLVSPPESLPGLIEEARKDEIVLIDTPSCASAAQRETFAGFMAGCAGIDVHLVLPGYMTASAARGAIGKYDVFRPSKLVVTKRDETATFGAVVSEAVRAGLSMSLITNGVAIPSDLHAASVDDLMTLALGRDRAEVVCA